MSDQINYEEDELMKIKNEKHSIEKRAISCRETTVKGTTFSKAKEMRSTFSKQNFLFIILFWIEKKMEVLFDEIN